MKEIKITSFMLERFRLGELSAEDNLMIRETLVQDQSLRISLEKLDESDRELRLRYPAEYFSFESLHRSGILPKVGRRRFGRFRRVALFAAALVLCVLVPISLFWRNGLYNPAVDRAKGSALREIELSLYLRGNHEVPLPEKAVLHEGDMVQLAYTAPAGEHYGIIFSIDGRSVVTLHYPYREGQSSLLVPGRYTFLNHAYILDDAPDFEVFVFVVSAKPMDVESVLMEARAMAKMSSYQSIEEISRVIFGNYDVETLTVLKRSANDEV